VTPRRNRPAELDRLFNTPQNWLAMIRQAEMCAEFAEKAGREWAVPALMHFRNIARVIHAGLERDQ
jgi:hypothetical protein